MKVYICFLKEENIMHMRIVSFLAFQISEYDMKFVFYNFTNYDIK